MTNQADSLSDVLIWEDANPGQNQWWSSRVQHLGREIVIAHDAFSGSLVVMERLGGNQKLKVIAALPSDDAAKALKDGKEVAARWLSGIDLRDITVRRLRWQVMRTSRMLFYDMPLLIAAAVLGAVIGWFVGVFFDTIGQRGLWTVLFGLVSGAALGPALSAVTNWGLGSKRSRNYRLVMVTVCAGLFGAMTVALMVLPGST